MPGQSTYAQHRTDRAEEWPDSIVSRFQRMACAAALLLACWSCADIVHAQQLRWDSIPEPMGGGFSRAVVSLSGAVYAQSHVQVQVSRDSGRTWRKVQDPIEAARRPGNADIPPLRQSHGFSRGICSIATDSSNNLFVLTSSGEIWKTVDDGAHWRFLRERPDGLWPYGSPVLMAGSAMLLAMHDSTLRPYIVRLDTADFSVVKRAIDAFPLKIAAAGNSAILCQYSTDVLVSTNEGLSWNSLKLPADTITAMLVEPDGAWLLSTAKGLLRSRDGGRSFAKLPGPGGHVALLTSYGATLIAESNPPRYAAASHTFRSDDHGATWSEIPRSAWNRNTVFVDDYTVISAENTVLRSTDRGGTWWVHSGLVAQHPNHLQCDGHGSLVAVSESEDGSIMSTTDQGRSWRWLGYGNMSYSIACIGRVLFTKNDGALIRLDMTTGRERSWKSYRSGFVAAGPDRTIYAYGDGHCEASTDLGETWLRLTKKPLVLSRSSSYAMVIGGEGSVLIGTTGEGIWRLDRTTGEWACAYYSDGFVSSLCADSAQTLYAVIRPRLVHGDSVCYVIRSLDGGTSWDAIHSNQESRLMNRHVALFDGGRIGLVLSLPDRLIRSIDKGMTWLPANLPYRVESLAVAPNGDVYAATDHGLFLCRLE
jgi:photosystem II stability/assembly factor-like uncharacterized protein